MTKRERLRLRRILRISALLMVLLVIIAFVAGFMRIRTLMAFRGEYVRDVDITDRVIAKVAIWLKDVEGANVDDEWIRSKTDSFIVKVDLDFDNKGLKKGTFTESVNNSSYAECEEKAYKLTADCLRELIIKRLILVGYAKELTDEDADVLIKEALGMTLYNYIKNSRVEIFPDYNEFAEEVTRTGDYRIRGTQIEWERNDKKVKEEFRVSKDTIIIVEAEDIYKKQGDK
ncbi:MAG: hypothetical protein K6E98_12340 [Lachnospiraceae bacterium]|nr:hypothetical protein [Lachnospiraceae bacterium]